MAKLEVIIRGTYEVPDHILKEDYGVETAEEAALLDQGVFASDLIEAVMTIEDTAVTVQVLS